jgi:hypothetical protein
MNGWSSRKRSNVADGELLDQFDQLVLRAVLGDRGAIAALSIGYGPVLLQQARKLLGKAWASEAGPVLADLFAGMLEGTLEFVPGRDRGRAWLRAKLRGFAAKRRLAALPN